MKILYDYQIFSWQKYGGISRYFVEIINEFRNDIDVQIGVKFSDNVHLSEKRIVVDLKSLYTNPRLLFLKGIEFRGKGMLYRYLKKRNPEKYQSPLEKNKEYTIQLLKKQDFDVFHPTYYDDYFLEYIGNKPFVLTIHDMIHELYPELITDDPLLAKQKANLAQKAAHIITVSEHTKQDVIDILGISEHKISVVYHASSLSKTQNSELKLPDRYLLYIGDRAVYKNFYFFLNAISSVLLKQKDLYVVCSGWGFSEYELTIFKKLGIENQILSIFFKDEELFSAYNKAVAFVFTSYSEGFGIPIIEAFDSSCPVILSNSSCFPEIARDAALYFHPKNTKEIQDTINRITQDSGCLRIEMINKGFERIKDFSWNKSALKTKEVYTKVIKL